MVADCRDKKQVTRYLAKEPPRFVCEEDPERKLSVSRQPVYVVWLKSCTRLHIRSSLLDPRRCAPHVDLVTP